MKIREVQEKPWIKPVVLFVGCESSSHKNTGFHHGFRIQYGLNVRYGFTYEEAYYNLLSISPWMLKDEQNQKFFNRFIAG